MTTLRVTDSASAVDHGLVGFVLNLDPSNPNPEPHWRTVIPRKYATLFGVNKALDDISAPERVHTGFSDLSPSQFNEMVRSKQLRDGGFAVAAIATPLLVYGIPLIVEYANTLMDYMP